MSPAAGWGLDPYGSGPWGGATTLSIASAFAVSIRTVRVLLTAEPVHLSPTGNGDALNPETWQVFRLDTGAPFTPIEVDEVDPFTYDINVLENFAPFLVMHQVSSSSLVQIGGLPITDPKAATFPGAQADKVSTPAAQLAQRRQLQDLLNQPSPNDASPLAGTLVIGAGGDYQRQSGASLARKLIMRRLTTPRGGFFHLPNYGVGLTEKAPLRIGDATKYRAQVEAQVLAEPEVESVKAPISLDRQNEIVVVQVKAKLRNGSAIEEAIPIPSPLVSL